jgi:DNA-binding SARP family transcriptional activator/sugar lactone lactonase YvrE
LEVVDGERPVSIRRGKEQALLAYLLLHPNQVVPSERLIDELWGERPPATAAKILQNAVSHLRKQLGDGRLLTRDPGYLLQLGPDELDADRFERLAQAGQPREALALWRGTPLVELQDELFADNARRRLDDRHAATLEDRIDHDLQAGHNTGLVPELERLINQHPLRERLHGQLMLALYRSGRQADALEAYQHARRILETQLGLQPGPHLQQLQQQILNHDPTLTTPTRKPHHAGKRRPTRKHALIALAVLSTVAGVLIGVLATRGNNSSPLVATGNSLAVVDPGRNRVVDVVPLGTTPSGIAVSPSGVWIANPRNNTVSRLSPKTHELLETIGLGASAYDIATGAGGVWVVTGNDDTLVHLDERTGGMLDTLRLPHDEPPASAFSIAFNDGAVWATSGGKVVKIDAHTAAVIAHGDCCGVPTDISVGEGGVWITDLYLGLLLISPESARTLNRVKTGYNADSVLAADGSVWASVTDNRGENAAVLRYDPRTLAPVQTIPVAPPTSFHPNTLTLTAGAGSIWVADADRGTLVRIDPSSGEVVATIRIGGAPRATAVADGRVWVTVN